MNVENVDWVDIDVYDKSDPLHVSDFVLNIYDYLKEKEVLNEISGDLNHQTQINNKMRTILVDWLVEVHKLFKLISETLFLTIDILDRYLQVKDVVRNKLQLVGVTSMLIAAKFEEIYSPEVKDFVYVSDNSVTSEDILEMEQDILRSIDFNLANPSPLHFLRRYSKAAGSDYFVHTLCKYLLEISLMDNNMHQYTLSLIASSAVYLARKMLKQTPLWSTTLEHYTQFTESNLQDCFVDLQNLVVSVKNSRYQNVVMKYATPNYGEVSALDPMEEVEMEDVEESGDE